MKSLALFGGTFDPVHHGHLRVAWEAAEALDAEVRLVHANVPPHRPQPGASAEQRLAMLRLALAGQSRLAIDARETNEKLKIFNQSGKFYHPYFGGICSEYRYTCYKFITVSKYMVCYRMLRMDRYMAKEAQHKSF